MKNRVLAVVSLLAGLLVSASRAQTIPAFTGPTLANETLHLPSGSKAVLVLGFSKKSGDACKPWFDGVATQLKSKPQVGYYEMPVLAGAPTVIRGMIVHNIRNSLNTDQQKHFAPVMENAQPWKDAAHFSAPDDPYILIIDEHGTILWRDSGAWSPAKEHELQQAIASLL